MGPFKTYDIRALYPDEIDEDFAFHLGFAFATYLEKNKLGKKVVIGRDFRHGSKDLQDSFVEACVMAGLDVTLIGICMTPCLYYYTKEFDVGVMITASHNPKEYNGFKFCLKNAVVLNYDSGLSEIEELMKDVHTFEVKDGSCTTKTIEAYHNAVVQLFKKEDFKDLKVVVDSGNGVAGISYPEIFGALDINYHPLFLEFDSDFKGRGPNPTLPGSLDVLKQNVLAHKADIGIAFDADADRLVVLDSKGKEFEASNIGKVLAKYYMEESKTKKESFVLDLRLSKSLSEYIHDLGGDVFISRVGQSFLKNKMLRSGAVLGIEVSGHIMHKSLMNIDDPVLSALVFMKQLKKEGVSSAELNDALSKYYMQSFDVRVKDKNLVLENIKKHFKDARLEFTDGISFETNDYWGNIRPSNTEPLLRITVEARTQEKSAEILGILQSLAQ
ncbi:MAG: phosphomannomutase/phosphoglucomutase [Candidatus Woesearchaeota archaeon]